MIPARVCSAGAPPEPVEARGHDELGVRRRLGVVDAEAAGEWVHLYAPVRRASESLNMQMQSARGLQGRMRGLAARSFVFTFIAGATNLHRIDTFLTDHGSGVQRRSKTPRKRDIEDRTHRRRGHEAPTDSS